MRFPQTPYEIFQVQQKRLSTQKELFHHGIKGQKWGVRRTPEELGHKPHGKETLEKTNLSSKIVLDAIRSGRVSKELNREKQSRHTIDQKDSGRSYINGDDLFAIELINRLCGTGTPIFDRHGDWTRKEAVTDANIVGIHRTQDGQREESRAAMIVYSKTGAHIYPRKEDTK